MRPYLSVLILLLLAIPAAAEQKYSTWNNPDRAISSTIEGGSLAKLLSELKVLIDEAQKARAADPIFLRDLRALALKYQSPWGHLVFSDDFLDGNYTANPAWTIVGGKTLIEKGWGLRNAIAPGRPAATSQQSGQGDKVSGEDAAIALLGAILKQSSGDQSSGDQSGAATPLSGSAGSASMHTPAAISNAFTIKLELSSWHAHVAGQGDVRFKFGPYLGNSLNQGYRLSYTAGDPLRLWRQGARGATVVKSSAKRFSFEDQKAHKLTWTRDTGGNMKVSVDGVAVIDVADREFQGAFAGLMMENHGGDFIVKRVSVHDAAK